MEMAERWRPAWADVDLDAVVHNAALLGRLVAPAELCAVVKADAYGHGSLAVARAAVAGGASWLAVALVEEGVALREAGLEVPILLLSEPPADGMAEAIARGLSPTVYTEEGIAMLDRLAREGGHPPVGVHLKVDTGMHRVGAAPAEIPALARQIDAAPHLVLDALWTHFAVADGARSSDREFTNAQVARFDETLAALVAEGLRPRLEHLANTAGAIATPAARRHMVRCGLGLYGLAPTPALEAAIGELTGGDGLRPALSFRTQVTFVRELDASERVSYGLRRPLPEASRVAIAPVGYADGVPRRLFDVGGHVLINGVRRLLAGSVTMDQIIIDCGPSDTSDVKVGDEVVLLGRQGDDEIGAREWAEHFDTIHYEILCDIGPRVPRRHTGTLPS